MLYPAELRARAPEGALSIPRPSPMQALRHCRLPAHIGLPMQRVMRQNAVSAMIMILLGACSAADGNWPSLRTAQEQKGGLKPPPVSGPASGQTATADAPLPVIPMSGQAGAKPDPITASLAPAVTRLEQEVRAIDFTLDRLAETGKSLAAAKAAAAGKPASAVETNAVQAAQQRRDQLLVDLDDSRDTVRSIAGQLAIAASNGETVSKPVTEAGKLLTRLSAARSAALTPPQPDQIAADIRKALQRFDAAETGWQAQAKKLRASTAAAAKNDPDRINWNLAQIELTRVNQSARGFGTTQDALEKIAGDLAILSATGSDVSAPLKETGALLARIRQRLAENDLLVRDMRKALERG